MALRLHSQNSSLSDINTYRGSMVKYVLFDFDGTLVDSREVFIKSFNQIAHKYNFKKIEPVNLDQLRNLSMIDRFRFLNVPLYKLPFLRKEFLSLYESGIGSLALLEGMESVLRKITNLGLEVGILSSNSERTIKNFLKNNGIPDISEVYSSRRLFGKHRVFRKFLKEKKLAAGEVLYVCDELRDILACNRVQVEPIWVSWGFELKEAMNGGNIRYSAHTPEDLFAIIHPLTVPS